MTEEPGVFDLGLQLERTALAWRRTALSLLAGSLLGMRVLLPELGWWAVATGLVGMALGAGIFVAANSRHRRAHSALLSTPPAFSALRHGVLLALTAAGVLCGAVVALVFVILRGA